MFFLGIYTASTSGRHFCSFVILRKPLFVNVWKIYLQTIERNILSEITIEEYTLEVDVNFFFNFIDNSICNRF